MKFQRPIIESNAVISEDGTHRYSLWRVWDHSAPRILFIGLNPSRADATFNDPTITRCINFAQAWQYKKATIGEFEMHGECYNKYGGMYFLNLFSFRTPKPKDLQKAYLQGDAYHDKTEFALHQAIQNSDTVVCCWGSWKFIQHQTEHVLRSIKDPYCFGINADGQPKHPLYLKATTELTKYVPQ